MAGPDPAGIPSFQGGRVVGSPFRAAWWCRGPHQQTLWPYLFRQGPRPSYRRERVELPDGDFIDLDWCGPPDADTTIVILHGLEGSSASHYVRALAHALNRLRIRGVVMHQRGCSGEPNRLARFYHGGETSDLHRVLGRLRERSAAGRFYAVGYSLGGNILLKWLGEAGDGSMLDAAVAVSVPFRLDIGARRLEQGLSRLYQAYLLRAMKRSVRLKKQRMAHPVASADIARCASFQAIDTCLTAPLHGFRDARDYYQRSSCRQFLGSIRVPTLILHAADDPFLTPAAIPGEGELSPHTQLELSPNGGHCGFLSGLLPLRPRYWLDERIPDFIRTTMRSPAA